MHNVSDLHFDEKTFGLNTSFSCKLHIYKHRHENKGLENKLQRSLYT